MNKKINSNSEHYTILIILLILKLKLEYVSQESIQRRLYSFSYIILLEVAFLYFCIQILINTYMQISQINSFNHFVQQILSQKYQQILILPLILLNYTKLILSMPLVKIYLLAMLCARFLCLQQFMSKSFFYLIFIIQYQ